MKIHTVTELNTYIAECLGDVFSDRAMEGEVSEFKLYPSGHWYFTLKDAGSSMSCTMWRSAAQKHKVPLRVGERVRLFGGVQGYAVKGSYSFNVLRFERSGEGDLAQRLEELRKRLGAEGLFDPDKKRPLPPFPTTVGIATARDSAALADMLRLIGDRYPVQIVLAPCRVQGEGAAVDIARAVRWLNQDPRVDVIIVGRGGGSAEDLFAFNEEVAVRAVAASRVPIISAVGHESDQCLCDLAADLRAPTPSAAAKAVVPDAHDIQRGLDVAEDRLIEAIQRHLRRNRERLRAVRLVHPQQRLQTARAACTSLSSRLNTAVIRFPQAAQARLSGVAGRLAPAAAQVRERRRQQLARAESGLEALSPLRVLDRGYAIVQHEGAVVRNAADLRAADVIGVRFARGTLTARVERLATNDGSGANDADG